MSDVKNRWSKEDGRREITYIDVDSRCVEGKHYELKISYSSNSSSSSSSSSSNSRKSVSLNNID